MTTTARYDGVWLKDHEEYEVSDARGDFLLARGLAVPTKAPVAKPAPAPTPEVPDLDSMSKAELVEKAEELGLPTSGTKATLSAAISVELGL